MSAPASELLISELRQHGDAAAAQVLLVNRGALARLSAHDRHRAEALIRGVVSRLLEEPEAHLKRLTEDVAGDQLEAVRALFGLSRAGEAEPDEIRAG